MSSPSAPYRPVPIEPTKRNVRFAVGVLTFMNLFNYLDRYVLPAVLASIDRELHIGYSKLGLLGSAFIIVYMIASPVFGRLGDQGSRRKLLAVGIALWSVASAATGMAHSFGGLLAARSAVGVGEAAYATIAPSLISDYYPSEKRGRIMAYFFAAIPAGSALGYFIGGLLASKHGWRSAFYFTGLPGIALALLALFIYEPARGACDNEADKIAPPPWREALAILGRTREYVWAVAGYTAATFGVGGLSFWMPTYLNHVRDVPIAQANKMVGLLVVVAGLLGTLIGGWLGDAVRGRIRGAYLFLCGWSGIITGVLATAMFLTPSVTTMYVLLFFSALFAFIPNGPVNTLIVNTVPGAVRATASAVSIFCIHFFGDAGSPYLIGWIADKSSLRTAVLLVPVSIGIAGVVWLLGRRATLSST